MYFVCEVRRIPLPGFLATYCATVDSEVDGIEDLDLLYTTTHVNIIAVYNNNFVSLILLKILYI